MPHSDWRSPAAYDRARELEPSGFAWECLRRNPDYQRDHRELARSKPRSCRDHGVQKEMGPLLL